MNLVQTLRDDEHVFLVMEYVSNGDLFDKIATRKGLSECEAKYVFQQLLEALAYMHEEHVVLKINFFSKILQINVISMIFELCWIILM